MTKRQIVFGLLMSALMACTPAARAQNFPDKPVRIVVPYDPGATTDTVARLVAQELGQKWKQPVIVENRPGASGGIGASYVSRSAPDGYALMVTPAGVLTTNQFLYSDLLYDPETLVPVSLIATTPLVLVNRPSSNITTLQQLIDYAKANPGKLNFGSQGVGNVAHLAPEQVSMLTGAKMAHIPYKGSAPAMTALLAGNVDFIMCLDMYSAGPQIQAGKLRAVASCDMNRNPRLPGVPAIAETVPGFDAKGWFGMFAPPDTPSQIVEKISRDIAEVMKSDAVKKRLAAQSIDPVGSTPQYLGDLVKRERARWGQVIRDEHIKVD